MNVNKKIVAVLVSVMMTSPLAMANETVDDQAISSLLGENTYSEGSLSAKKAESKEQSNLIFNATESIEKAKAKMALEEQNNTLDLEISIAKKSQELKQIETEDEVAQLTLEIERLRDELADAEEDLLEVEEEMFHKDQQISKLRRSEAQLRSTVANLQSEKVKDVQGLTDVRLTRVSAVGNDKEATLLYGLSVIKRREGEMIGDKLKIKRINFDNIVITNGRMDKTVFIIHENIAEGANAGL